MYRIIFRTVVTTRSSPVSVYDSCVLAAKCDKAVSRVANGGGIKALSTCSVSRCEKKDSDVLSNQDQKANADKEDGKAEVAEQREEPVVLKVDDGGAAQQQTYVKTEQAASKQPIKMKTDPTKSGKESLLDLLGAMKVEVTNKRKLKNLKAKQNYESVTQYMPKTPAMESTSSMYQKATGEASSQSETLDPDLVAAASAAASTLPNCSQAESELLRQLKQHEAITEAQKKGNINNLGVLIADMKVGKNPHRQNAWPADQIRFDDDGRGYTHHRGITSELSSVRKRRNMLLGKRLNIFSPTTDEDGVETAAAQLTLWDMDFANQLSLATSQMPRNRFEEMIQWTKEGKLWQYPVNNEAGLEEEAKVPFHEHIFLEKHLEEGFPHEGPVRHFMELVVAGLSRNPYLTVQQKKEHIYWFKDYFHQKEEVLKEADVYLE
ncbi:small ribosomal subunit protein mS31 [Archocentrus centrarchus]|uniref:small ribosomal subunit protein mS31 n=1 Tax=Archocentrus centrarchus TaxID=63155 RepID=UPI0011EA4ABA|nr:28S ribosomal protein S31, mitochondrial [Archocentrus centrarchus]